MSDKEEDDVKAIRQRMMERRWESRDDLAKNTKTARELPRLDVVLRGLALPTNCCTRQLSRVS